MKIWGAVLLRLLKIGDAISKSLRKTPVEKRKEAMRDLDNALDKARDPKDPDTKELEKWFSEKS